MNSQNQDKDILKPREWLFIIGLVIGTLTIIALVVDKFGETFLVVKNWEFAGTITSIILAILAIVYTFYQNFSQENNTARISNEINNLSKLVDDLKKQNEKLSKLDVLLDEVGLLRKSFDGIKTKNQTLNSGNLDPEEQKAENAIEKEETEGELK